MHKLNIKRIYELASKDDGIRILVDRLWPRGISKVRAQLDFWDKDIAPTPELRIWFGHKSERFKEFTQKYKEELKQHYDELYNIKKMLLKQNVTLLYAAKDPKVNHAIVLKEIISNLK